MPYRSTSTAEYPPDGKSIGTYEQTAYEITIKTQDQIAKKKMPKFFLKRSMHFAYEISCLCEC